MKLVLTSGATREAIDEVRFITNFSTGQTGAFLADFLSDQGHDVSVLLGQGAQRPRYARNITEFLSFQDLDSKLRKSLSTAKVDGIIHLAAISDYTIDSVQMGAKSYSAGELKKIDSTEDITLKLKRNYKIVAQLKQYAAPTDPVIVAFKLTNSNSYAEQIQAIKKLSDTPGVDFVVHNDFHDIQASKDNRYRIFEKDKVLFESLDRQSLAAEIEILIKERV
jgi:phosphopantothenoylcysteine synthetase/decarboxylase